MKKILLFLLCLLLPGLVRAASVTENEPMVNALSKAIDEYKSLDQGLSHYDVVLRRDPMQVLVDDNGNIVNPAGLHTGLMVQGVIRSKDFKRILVDDELYSEGEMVGPYQVLEIKENGFWAGEEDEKIFVPLYSENSELVSPEGSVSQ